MRFRRRDDGDNPAWPGLVDLFAFTMVLILVVSAGSDDDSSRLREENRRLRAEVARLTKENQELRARLKELEDLIIIGGKKQLDSLHQELVKAIDQAMIKIVYHEKIQEIEIKGEPEIVFGTAQFELSPGDRERLTTLAKSIFDKIKDKAFFILINGTADPRRMVRSLPPRNNVELSALRAATTAALLEEAAPGISKYLRVVGLVETGELIQQPPPDPDVAYQQYRRLNLVIKVDIAEMLKRRQADGAAP